MQVIFRLMSNLSIILMLFFYSGCTKQETTTHKTLKHLYRNKSGHISSSQETQKIIALGGAPTYGEITYASMQALINKLKLTSSDVFYDLGCGIGKTVFQVYLNSPVQKSIGIELSPSRIKTAKTALAIAKQKNLLTPNRIIEFHEKNITDFDFKDATVVYLCSTCYSNELMETITKKLALGEKNLRIITLKPLPQHKDFELIKTYNIATTWDTWTSAYLYQRSN